MAQNNEIGPHKHAEKHHSKHTAAEAAGEAKHSLQSEFLHHLQNAKDEATRAINRVPEHKELTDLAIQASPLGTLGTLLHHKNDIERAAGKAGIHLPGHLPSLHIGGFGRGDKEGRKEHSEHEEKSKHKPAHEHVKM